MLKQTETTKEELRELILEGNMFTQTENIRDKSTGLKPCPFCGSTVKMETESQDKPPFGTRVWIRCKQCRQSQVCSDWYGGDLGTMEASWQTRQ